MAKIKRVIALGLLLVSMAAWAQKTDGLIVTTGDNIERQFAFSEVKQLMFSDNGLTIVKMDGVTVEIPADWQIRFGEIDDSGIPAVELSDGNAIAQVYNVDGILVKQLKLSQLHAGELPDGVYIIKCNGKAFKIMITQTY